MISLGCNKKNHRNADRKYQNITNAQWGCPTHWCPQKKLGASTSMVAFAISQGGDTKSYITDAPKFHGESVRSWVNFEKHVSTIKVGVGQLSSRAPIPGHQSVLFFEGDAGRPTIW